MLPAHPRRRRSARRRATRHEPEAEARRHGARETRSRSSPRAVAEARAPEEADGLPGHPCSHRGPRWREGEGGGGEIRLAAPAGTLGLDPLRAVANFEAEEEEQVATAFGERERRQILRRRRPQQRLGRGAPASRDVLVSSVARRSSCSGAGAARRSSASSTEEEERWPAEQQCLVHRGGGVAAATSSIGCCLLRHGRPRPGGDPGERGGEAASTEIRDRRSRTAELRAARTPMAAAASSSDSAVGANPCGTPARRLGARGSAVGGRFGSRRRRRWRGGTGSAEGREGLVVGIWRPRG
ncbi:unnamed protein product [Urochloa humidicola]